eukprot:7001670-Prymnesium_polylepis.1
MAKSGRMSAARVIPHHMLGGERTLCDSCSSHQGLSQDHIGFAILRVRGEEWQPPTSDPKWHLFWCKRRSVSYTHLRAHETLMNL